MLQAALNKSWREHLTNKELYGNIHKISVAIREQRLRFTGHCWRSEGELHFICETFSSIIKRFTDTSKIAIK